MPRQTFMQGRTVLLNASETTKRLELDAYARFKYDKSQDADAGIIERVKELAESNKVNLFINPQSREATTQG